VGRARAIGWYAAPGALPNGGARLHWETRMTERMYTDLASYWPLLSPLDEYVEEASVYRKILCRHEPRPRTLLELGAGGGHNAFHMKGGFSEVTLVDRSPGMLEVSRKLNPELVHVEGDMRDVRLGQLFDAVFVHDAICYMTSRDDLQSALATAAAHTRPGGILLVAPDETKERFESSTSCGGSDDPEGRRGVRYLEWVYDPDPTHDLITSEYAYLLRAEDGTTTSVYERHYGGLFARQTWLDLLEEVGFDARSEIVDHDDIEGGHELFIGTRR
jgi:SAM-dependent methyltransferase